MAKSKKAHNPHESIVIQAGIVFILVSAIAITAYVFATYYSPTQARDTQVEAGY